MRDIRDLRENINAIDKQMARLFEERMSVCAQIASYKRAHDLPVRDKAREEEVVARNIENADEKLSPYYESFIKHVIELSCQYQETQLKPENVANEDVEISPVDDDEFCAYANNAYVRTVRLDKASYDVVIEEGALKRADKYLNLNRRVLVVTDDGVPREYSESVLAKCKEGLLCVLKRGEASKSFDNFKSLLSLMSDNSFTRKDCVVAVGGGVVGDLAGFVASCYMRGVDFYNIPTTLLAQVDSSVGGKTAIDFDGVKNIVGTFYQPKKVLIDVRLLSTLDERLVKEGLAEAIKMACTSDKELFELIENATDVNECLQTIVQKSIEIKASVVENDEKESGLRKMLNFGHTLGHAIEAREEGRLLHGECVALGMLPMCGTNVRARLKALLEKSGLLTEYDFEKEELIKYIVRDKKSDGEKISVVVSDEVGSFRFESLTPKQILKRV